MNYFHDIGYDDIRGLCDKLSILNANIDYHKSLGNVVYPRLKINGKDSWKDYFNGDFDYEIYDSCLELREIDPNARESHVNFLNNIQFNKTWLDKGDELYAKIGSPKIVFYLRETDKAREHPILPPIFYSEIIAKDGLIEPILAMSDCEYSINYLQNRHDNIISLPHHRSINFMPMHLLLKNKFNFNSKISEKLLLEELILEIILICKVKKVYYGTWAGILTMTDYFLPDNSRPDLININQFNNDKINEVIAYYKERESFLWSVILDYYYR